MSMSDTVADMLTRIRNGQKSKLINIVLPHSKLKCAILEVLKEEGFITQYNILTNKNISQIEVELKYSQKGSPAICSIQKVSKSSKRIYSSIAALKGYYNSMGIYILSTPQGVLSDRKAHQLGVGGEIICKVF